ncbi:transglycosylase SLT domain-containing protein [Orbaceae bacterium ESL0721]|nr:transglycosylase SLT domain-containing protein [Orbaceae bacterium ESL0721]
MKKSLLFILLCSCSCLAACQHNSPKYNSSTYRSSNTQTAEIELDSYAAITQNPWKFIQTKITVEIPDNSRIDTEREKILLKSNNFETIASRSEPYVYYIVNQLSQNNLPIELALIPLIESAYDPLATSAAKAAGLWQFVPITAKEYGLKHNNMFDGRRDLIQSTSTAITLLQNLNNRFNGDWLLTLAAYNAGEGRVRRAIAENQAKGLPTDFWSLKLPKETMRYVPKVLAIIDIVKNSQEYNVKLPTCSYENSLVQIDMSKNISLTKIAKYAGIPLNDLISFNAGYVKQTVNGPFHLLIPYVYAENLYQKLQADNLVANEIVELLQDAPHNRVIVETPATHIVDNKNIDNKDVDNKEIASNSKTAASLTVKNSLSSVKAMPITDTEYSNTELTQTSYLEEKSDSNDNTINYLVKSGDNLYSIAQNYRVKIADIVMWNNLKNPRIKEGDVLTINL